MRNRREGKGDRSQASPKLMREIPLDLRVQNNPLLQCCALQAHRGGPCHPRVSSGQPCPWGTARGHPGSQKPRSSPALWEGTSLSPGPVTGVVVPKGLWPLGSPVFSFHEVQSIFTARWLHGPVEYRKFKALLRFVPSRPSWFKPAVFLLMQSPFYSWFPLR